MTFLIENYRRSPLSFASGDGVWLRGADGKRYLDLVAGIAVNPLGHRHRSILHAIRRASRSPLHLSNLYEIPEQETLARMLCARAGNGYRALFVNSGTEANEAALKLARKATGRTRLISFSEGFHGRTFGSLSLTPKPTMQDAFVPLVPDCATLAFNDLEDLRTIDRRVAGVIVECIQGEGGLVAADPQWMKALRKRTRDVGALLIVDEVQTGMGRTGTFFCYEQYGIAPDMITMAKGLGGGVPIGALIAREKVAKHFTPGSHGSTFGGNPFVCTVAGAVVNVIGKPAFFERVARLGAHTLQELRIIAEEFPEILIEIRGRGLMIGIVFTAPDLAKEAKTLLEERGILTNVTADCVMRLLPPLIIEGTHINRFLRSFRAVLRIISSRAAKENLHGTIVPATVKDLATIRAIHRACSRKPYRTSRGTPYLKPLTREEMQSLLPRTFMLTKRTTIIGKVHWQMIGRSSRAALLGGLAVRGGSQGNGHARVLIAAALSSMKNDRYRRAAAITASPQVQSLLRGCGWKENDRAFPSLLRKSKARFAASERGMVRMFILDTKETR
ncbi:acetylornithine/succinylornithine family transaminase [Candidatus Peregrinibacteria bacterium]|nr:acetylornithine/succinylornithine family transaminase [Candidatus Peregrinibacteria bacterium]